MEQFKCPKCSSSNVISGNKGFGYTRAVGGALLFGPIGALLGGTGRHKIINHCMLCDHRWDHSAIIEKRKQKEDWNQFVQHEKKEWQKVGNQWKSLFNLIKGK